MVHGQLVSLFPGLSAIERPPVPSNFEQATLDPKFTSINLSVFRIQNVALYVFAARSNHISDDFHADYFLFMTRVCGFAFLTNRIGVFAWLREKFGNFSKYLTLPFIDFYHRTFFTGVIIYRNPLAGNLLSKTAQRGKQEHQRKKKTCFHEIQFCQK